MSKVWFITGASKGFGREWAEAALERGDSVAATARRTETLDALVATYGDRVLPLRLDVTDREAGRALEQAEAAAKSERFALGEAKRADREAANARDAATRAEGAARKEAERAAAEAAAKREADRERAGRRYDQLHERIIHQDAYDVDYRVEEILSGLGFPESDFHREASTFSGAPVISNTKLDRVESTTRARNTSASRSASTR